MKCQKCGFDNPNEAKFCIECATPLDFHCPNCGAVTPATGKFCMECAHELSKPIEAPPVDYSQPESYTPRFLADKILTTRSSIEGERKLVTVFFADVAGYTPMTEKLDPEEVHQIMDGAFKILMDEIHRFEGTINQFTGDGVMALFGAPLAHEDHAQRACHAALSVQKALGEYGDKVKTDTGLEFKMRIGLNSGHVIVGSIGDDLRMDYTAVGDTTNLASRMENLATPGSVMVSAHTHSLAMDYFEFNSLGKVEIKGKEEKQEAYELIKTGEVVSRIGASVSKGLTRFVGRKISMDALNEPYDRVVEGSGQVVGIVGEAGVGKSRLLLEFINRLPPGEYTYLEGRCLHYGGSMAYLPVIDVLKSYFEIKDGDREYLIKKKIEEQVMDLDLNLEQILPSFQEVLSLKVDDEIYLKQDAQMKKILTFEALRDLFIRISQGQPLVLVIEDLHWMDKISEDFIDYLIGWLANSKIQLLLLYRPEYTHQWGSKSYYSKIGLDQLNLDNARELVKAMLEGGEVAPELRELILSRSAGNPLFMEEFTQTLIENGSIKKQDNQFVLDGDIKDIQVPDTIQGIISARMDRLEDNLKRTMQVASVIGRDFAFRILQSITGMREELKSYLLNLQGLEFIYEKKLFPELEYIFKHALIQEVAYNSLLVARRKEIHQKIAEAIEQLYSDRIEEFYERLAYHYSGARNLSKAYQYLKLSTDKALAIYAYGEAVKLLEQALKMQEEMTPEDKVKRCEILIELGNTLIPAGEPRRVLDREASEAWLLAQEIGDKKLSLNVCAVALFAMGYYGAGTALTSPEAVEWSERVDSIPKQETVESAKADAISGRVKFFTGDTSKGVSQLNRALELARNLGDESTFWQVAGIWLHMATSPQHAEERLNLAEALKRQVYTGVDLISIGLGLTSMADTFLAMGQRGRMEEILTEYESLAERTDHVHPKMGLMRLEIIKAHMEGDLKGAITIGNDLLTLGKESNLSEYTIMYYNMLALRPLLHLGLHDDFIRTSLPTARAPFNAYYMAHLGQHAEAMEILNQVNQARSQIAPDKDESWVFYDIILLESAVIIGHRDFAERTLTRFIGSEIKTTGLSYTTIITRHLGAAAAMLGKPDEAQAHYQDAIEASTDMRFRPELALTRFQLAELQFEHFPEERTEALEHLEFAISEFKEMKMKPSLEKALKLKKSLGSA